MWLVALFQIWYFCGYSLNTLKYPKMGMCYFFLWTLPPPPIFPLFWISGLSDMQHLVMRQKMCRFSHFLMRELFVCRLHDWNLKNKENASKKKEHWRWTATCKLISDILTTDPKQWTKEFKTSVLTEISVLEITNFCCNMMGHLETLGTANRIEEKTTN